MKHLGGRDELAGLQVAWGVVDGVNMDGGRVLVEEGSGLCGHDEGEFERDWTGMGGVGDRRVSEEMVVDEMGEQSGVTRKGL